MKLDISIPTDVEQRVIDAFARRHEYKDEVPELCRYQGAA